MIHINDYTIYFLVHNSVRRILFLICFPAARTYWGTPGRVYTFNNQHKCWIKTYCRNIAGNAPHSQSVCREFKSNQRLLFG